jgi:hypothetical protein
MPRSVLVSEMMTSAREHANDPTGKLASDPKLIAYLNQAYGLYYQTLVEADPAFYQTETTFSTVAGTKAYALPTDWISTIHVGRLIGSRYSKLDRLNVDEVFDYAVNGCPTKYQPEGGQLALYATPDAAYTIKHIYIPSWTKLTDGAQEIDGLLGNEELIELEAAIRLRGKDEVDASDLVARRDLALQRLMKQAFQRTVVDSQVAGEKFIDEGPAFAARDRDLLFW